jgi:hypothetical protein
LAEQDRAPDSARSFLVRAATPVKTITLSIRPLSAAYRPEATPFGLRMIEDVSELHGLLLTKS